MVFTIRLDEFHRAHLDPITGAGLIVCPRPERDVWLDGHSVFTAAWDDAVAHLARVGWFPVRDERDFLRYEGCTADGSLVVAAAAEQALVPREPGHVDTATWTALCEAAGLTHAPRTARAIGPAQPPRS
ncbi:hypothetical protein GCM10022215_17650 [Nocardioides fonticola]|uniref:Uncharacterized protein n=1 Tax=Nocardioides fonticola TaxID=450363 RepID=A0ABP7XI92_9ACTN